ncbi:hypothetical protein [Fibrella arboris]|uniref:hypothetical protein n=1 Tax=Fibrella arboris TaxID=3242486 RepID=UPI0035202D3A
MKQFIIMALPLVVMAACTQEMESSEQMTQQAQKEQAMIEKGVQSLRIASFYIADPQDATTNEEGVPAESMAIFARKSKLYQADELMKQPVSLASRQYQSFVKANATDPRLKQFKRETAEKFLMQVQALPAAEKAFFTNELIVNRSSNLALMCTSLQSLRGKIDGTDYAMMVRQTQRLMNQYEQHYITELARNDEKPTTTYRQRAMKALDGRFAELALTMIRDNRRLLQGVE